jgi:hypothetical protein
LTTCPATNANNLLTGGLGASINLKSTQLYKDDNIVATADYCAYLAGEFTSILAVAYIPHIIAGIWKYQPLLGSYFSPLSNLVYKQKDPTQCTSTKEVHTTITYLAQPIQTNICDFAKFPQACAHYSSVNSRGIGGDLDTLVCPITKLADRALPALWNKQHHSSWRSWIASLPKAWGLNSCERDEWPALAFMAKDPEQQYTQWLRFVPQRDNNGAGKLWSGKCGKAKSQIKKEGGPINNLVCTEYTSTLYTVTGFSLIFQNTGEPSGRITNNPCLPTILTPDAGYAMMTNDMWYGDNIAAGYNPADYKAAPIAALTRGFSMPKNQPRRWLDEDPMLENSWTALQPAVHEILSQRPPSQYIPTQKLDIDPEDIRVDEGNSTRKATPKELWEAYGFFKCQKEGCPDERKAAGLVLEEEEMERLVQATVEVLTSTTVAAGSLPSVSFPSTTAAPGKGTSVQQIMITSAQPTHTVV